jgi:hypothetical protein
LLLTVSFAGCTESSPNRTIVTFQIDSDGDDFWIYLYTVPRIKMGNFTILTSLEDDTISSVFTHQKKISLNDLEKDSEGYSSLTLAVDVSEVFWEFNCKIRLNSDFTEDKPILDVIILEDNSEILKEWKLPYSTPMGYKS